MIATKLLPKVSFNWKARRFSDCKIVDMPGWNQYIVHYFNGRIKFARYDDNGYLIHMPEEISKAKAIQVMLSYRRWAWRRIKNSL